MLTRLLIWLGLTLLSLFTAMFAGAWGPDPFYVEYIPRLPEDAADYTPLAIMMLILWSPLLYGVVLWRWAARRDRAAEAPEDATL